MLCQWYINDDDRCTREATVDVVAREKDGEEFARVPSCQHCAARELAPAVVARKNHAGLTVYQVIR